MTLVKLPFKEKEVFERKHLFFGFFGAYVTKCSFLFVPCQILLRPFPETFFRRPKGVCLRPKGVFKCPHGRVRMKIHSLCITLYLFFLSPHL